MTIIIWILSIIFIFFFGIYLLYAIGKSLENFRRYHLEYFMPIYLGAILLAVGIHQYRNTLVMPTKIAKEGLIEISKECSGKDTTQNINNLKDLFIKPSAKDKNNISPIAKVKNHPIYSIVPSDSYCNGDKNKLIKAVSSNESIFPTYSINLLTGERSCFYSGNDKRFSSCKGENNGWD